MNPLRRLVGETAIYGLSSIIGRLLNYLLVPLYTRVLIPSDYGIYTEMYAYVSILWVILTYGMETTFFRFSQNQPDKKLVYSTAFFSVTFTSLIFLVGVLIYARPLAAYLGYAEHVRYVIWFAFILALDAVSAIPFAKLRQQNRPIKFAFLKLINIGSNIIFNLFFILLCPHILRHFPESFAAKLIGTFFRMDHLVDYIFISNLISSILTMVMQIPDFPSYPPRFDTGLWKKMLRYTWPLLIVSVAGSINLSFDKILLVRLLPEGTDVMAQVGIYGACYKVSIIMTLFVQTFRYAADPFFFNVSSRDDSRQLYADVLNLFMIAASAIFLITVLYLDVVILFIGSAYREGKGVIPVLLLGNMFLGVFYNFSIWYKLSDQTIFGALLSIIGAIITVVLNFLLIPMMGYYGSAWAAFVAYFTMMTLSYFIGNCYFRVPYNLKKAVFYPALAVILYLMVEWIGTTLGFRSMILNTALVIGYFLLIIRKEKPMLRQLIK